MIGLYFSGTGNSRDAAERFLRECGHAADAFAIEGEEAAAQLAEHDEVVFAYPVQYSAVPKIVRDFVCEHGELWRGKRVFIIATMALFSGDGAGVLARQLKRHGAVILGGLHLQMPDSIADEKVLKRSREAECRLVAAAGRKIARAAASVRAGRYPRQGLGLLSRMAGWLTQRLWFGRRTQTYSRGLKINVSQCVGCGVCAKHCPTGNITMHSRTAQSADRCTLCYRCVNLCPRQAITLLGNRVIRQAPVEQNVFERYRGESPFP